MPATSPQTTRPSTALVRRARKINRVLSKTYPEAHCELDFTNPFELLIATVMSAQTTDRRVNAVTPKLFARYPDSVALAAAHVGDVEEIIRSTGFYRAKAASIIKLSAALVANFSGDVPARLEELVTLPGVGRKTANVVLGNAFGIPGITVDTHFARLVKRFEWVDSQTAQDPVRTEHAVGELFLRRDYTQLSHHLIWHGRRCCHAKKPACGACPVARWCPAFGTGPTDPAVAATLITTQGPA